MRHLSLTGGVAGEDGKKRGVFSREKVYRFAKAETLGRRFKGKATALRFESPWRIKKKKKSADGGVGVGKKKTSQ